MDGRVLIVFIIFRLPFVGSAQNRFDVDNRHAVQRLQGLNLDISGFVDLQDFDAVQTYGIWGSGDRVANTP